MAFGIGGINGNSYLWSFYQNEFDDNMLISGNNFANYTHDGNAAGFVMRISSTMFIEWMTYLSF